MKKAVSVSLKGVSQQIGLTHGLTPLFTFQAMNLAINPYKVIVFPKVRERQVILAYIRRRIRRFQSMRIEILLPHMNLPIRFEDPRIALNTIRIPNYDIRSVSRAYHRLWNRIGLHWYQTQTVPLRDRYASIKA
jgi:hypothetical protein